MAAQVCVSIRESTTRNAVAAALRGSAWADLLEIRADFIEDLDLNLLFRHKPRPMIFTLRPRSQGGVYEGSERRRLETIQKAAGMGADFVDLEFSSAWQSVIETIPRGRVVLSHHDFDRTPADLIGRFEAMAAAGAGVVKIATRARCLADNISIEKLLKTAQARQVRLCALAMGPAGLPSRILGPSWGSWATFASLPGGDATAEGQVPADILRQSYRVGDITDGTLVYGVVGRPLGHSLSPRVHNAAFAASGADAVLLPLEADGFGDFLAFHSAFPLQGACVTLPYKGDGHALAESLSVAAEQTHAVNTLIRRQGRWHGENTDVEGFLRPLKRRVHPGKLRAVVLGAGGAARAAIYALRSEGTSVQVVARDEDKARAIAGQFQAGHAVWEHLPHLQWDLLVNATPVGMAPDIDQSPVSPECLTGDWVYDLVYNPPETRLLRDAAQRGCRTIGGGEMFLGQAWKQQTLWCGSPPPEGVMETEWNEAVRRNPEAE